MMRLLIAAMAIIAFPMSLVANDQWTEAPATGENQGLVNSPCDDPCCISPACGCDSWFDDGCCRDCCAPKWQFTANWLMMARVSPGAPIVRSAAGDPVLSTSDFNTGLAPGFDLAARRQLSVGMLDVRYFQVNGFSAAKVVNVLGTDRIADSTIGADQTIGFNDFSRLRSAEVNWLSEESAKGVRLLAGFRYLQYDERLGIDILAIPATVVASTTNDLVGFQIGLDGDLPHGSRIPIDMRGFVKAGVYHSDMKYILDLTPVGAPQSLSANAQDVAFVGELGLTASYRVTNWFSIDAGYRLLWLDGLAIAGEQLSTTSFAAGTVATNQGGVLLHGFTLGGTIAW